ncbi:Acyltransferase family protein [Microbacterium laevaniformans]|uniref:Acyltransferase family protein n=1 Tax=Microbacterium laevaniformans TaxID=36807 RepID=A0A150HEN8_9MICO|nr:Acyltransferase family protein [Microbacterium laevaniformans]
MFFLLSGFVIFANENHRVDQFGRYYLRRLRRIYPPLLCAMAVSTILWLGGWLQAAFSWSSFLGTLASLQDISFLKPGVIVDPYLGNDPLWSLSYEVAFYLLFPIVMAAWRRSITLTRWIVPVAAVVAYGLYLLSPNHFALVVAYFLTWWLGAMAAYLYGKDRLSLSRSMPELAGVVLLIAAAGVGIWLYGFKGAGYFPFLMFRHFLVVAALYVVLLTPLRALLATLFSLTARPAAQVASISYGLYVVHYPILVQTGAAQSPIWVLPALGATVIVAYIADRWSPALFPKAPR